MPIFILSILIQVAFVVHIMKTGRNTMWIYIVVFLPMAGSLAYLIVEVIPELMQGRGGQKVRRNIQKAVNPNKFVKQAANNYAVADTVENSLRLAEELLQTGVFEEAKQLLEKSLKGVHAHDPVLMHGLARAEFGLGNFAAARSILDDLIAHNPDYKNADAHLLYARAVDELGDTEAAVEEYQALSEYYPGPEPAYRFAMLLVKLGQHEKAKALLETILHKSKYSGRHYNSINKEWIALARKEYNNI